MWSLSSHIPYGLLQIDITPTGVSLLPDWVFKTGLQLRTLQNLVADELGIDEELAEFGTLLKNALQRHNDLLIYQEIVAIKQYCRF